MLSQKFRAPSQAFRVKAVKFYIVFKNNDIARTCLQPFAQAHHVGFIHALLNIRRMSLINHKLNPISQSDFRKFFARRFATVFTFLQRNAV